MKMAAPRCTPHTKSHLMQEWTSATSQLTSAQPFSWKHTYRRFWLKGKHRNLTNPRLEMSCMKNLRGHVLYALKDKSIEHLYERWTSRIHRPIPDWIQNSQRWSLTSTWIWTPWGRKTLQRSLGGNKVKIFKKNIKVFNEPYQSQ